MNILVIGGSGFVGQPLLRSLLAHGHEVTVLHRGFRDAHLPAEVRTVLGNRHHLLEHQALLRDLAPDVVVDLILSSGAQAQALIDIFRGRTKRLVVLSSVDVYRAYGVLARTEPGPVETLPLTEHSALRQRIRCYSPALMQKLHTLFGWIDAAYDKLPVEQVITAHVDLPATVLRLPAIYGPGDQFKRCEQLLRQMRSPAQTIVLDEQSANWRSPRSYVENVAEAITLAVGSEHTSTRVYNLAEEDAHTDLEWAQLLASELRWQGRFVTQATGREVERTDAQSFPPPNFSQDCVVSSERIRAELGFREVVPLRESLRRTIAWEQA